jgi:hypothetical protein
MLEIICKSARIIARGGWLAARPLQRTHQSMQSVLVQEAKQPKFGKGISGKDQRSGRVFCPVPRRLRS